MLTHPPHSPLFRLHGVCAALLILLQAASAGAAGSIRYENGRFSGQLQQADVTQVLAEIARLAHVEIRGHAAMKAPLDLALRNFSLHQALAHVLRKQSFLIFYRGEQPVRVLLVAGAWRSGGSEFAQAPGPEEGSATTITSGAGASASATPSGDGPSAPAPAEASASEDANPAATSNRPVTVHGALAEALGTDSISFSDVTAVAARDPDPAVRAEALRVGLSILEDESELSESLLQVIEQRDDATLADYLTRVAGDNAIEIARAAARDSRIEALRLRARAIEQYLDSTR